MKKLGLSWFLLVTCYYTFAQVITVQDKITGEKLELVSIRDTLYNTRIETGYKGTAPAASFERKSVLLFERVGYKSLTISWEDLQRSQWLVLLEPIPFGLGEVVIAANRWSQVARNIPGRVIAIKKKDRELFQPQTAADLLGTSGEIFIQKSQQAGGSPMIRGFSTNRLLYAVDGVRLNTAIFRAGNIQNVISLDPFAIEKTEVFFGPGSIVYGSDAIGGVMSFQTITPNLAVDTIRYTKVNGSIRFSSINQEMTGNASFTAGNKKWGSYTGITHSSYGDLRMGTRGKYPYEKNFYVERVGNTDLVLKNPDSLVQLPSGYQQFNLTQKIRFRPSQNWEFNYGFHYSETSSYSRYDRLIERQNNGLPRSAVWNYGPQIWMMNLLTISHIHKNRIYDHMIIRLAHQFFEESRIDRAFNGFRLRTNLEKVNAISLNIDFEKKINQHEFIYGLEWVKNKVQSLGSGEDIRNGNFIPLPDRYPASDWSSYAGFLNYQYSLNDQFLLQGGIRMNHYQLHADFSRLLNFYPFPFSTADLKNSSLTYSIGGVYKAPGNFTLKLNFNKGFRAPNVDDMGKLFDFVNGEVVVPNPNLRAEMANNFELGINKVFGQYLKVDVTFFFTRLENALVRRPYNFNGQDSILYNGIMSRVYAIQNAAHSRISGIQAGIEILFSKKFSLLSKYNLQTGREEMPNGEISSARHAAPGFGLTRLTYRNKGIAVLIESIYCQEVSFEQLNPEERVKSAIYAKDAAGRPFSPGWLTMNCKISGRMGDRFQIATGIDNIMDQRYRPYSSGIAAGGRNFYISLSIGRG
jgi:hemoglobin/transferrin/lactoferrin receptor protein